MQGPRGAIGSFSETLGFEQGSTSSDASVVDQQICWQNNLQNSPTNHLSDYISLNSINEEEQDISLRNLGEPPENILSLSDHNVTNNVTVNPPTSIGFKSPSAFDTSRGSTSGSSSFSEPYELDNRPLSRKRKAAELSVGQSSSGIGSSNMFQGIESSSWQEIALNDLVTNSNRSDEIIPRLGSSPTFQGIGIERSWQEVALNDLVPNPTRSDEIIPRLGSSNMFQEMERSWQEIALNNTRSDEIIPRLGLSVGGDSSTNPNMENGPRNVQPRINSNSNSTRTQDPSPANSNNRQSNVSVPYPSLRLNPVDFRSRPLPVTPENSSSHQGHPIRIPALRRNFQSTSRSSRNSSSRTNRPSFNLVISGDRNELDSISDRPLFVQPNNVQTASRAGPISGVTPPSAAPNSATHSRSSTHYNPRRLSALLRRTLSTTDLESGGGPNSNILPRIPPSVSSTSATGSASQDIRLPPEVNLHGPHQPRSRSSVLFGRQLEGAFGSPHLSRSMASGSEGRGRLVSEIRNVLDLMRRGEPLRFEDLMILDQSVFYGIADIHDRHRDMRLDIDNMSYEELLALEERIGNVNTGLNEEAILKHLKQKQFMTKTGQPDVEPCCICQEEYHNGDNLGTLECGHEFHHDCIKQWLQHKNLCPICKSAGFTSK